MFWAYLEFLALHYIFYASLYFPFHVLFLGIYCLSEYSVTFPIVRTIEQDTNPVVQLHPPAPVLAVEPFRRQILKKQ